jgi:hypothetical protein
MWWLPDAPEAKVPGVIKMNERGSTRLELIGCFRDMLDAAEVQQQPDGSATRTATAKALEDAGNYGRVCGQVGSKEYTLDDCYRGRWSSGMFGSAIASEEIRAGRSYRGIWLDASEPARFDQADVELQWLPFWLMESAIGEQWTFEEQANNTQVHNMQVSVSGLPTRRCRPWTGYTVALNHRAEVTGDRVTGRVITQGYYFSVTTTALTDIDELLEVAGDLQTLVSFGVNRPVGFESVTLRHPKVHPPKRTQRKFRYPIEMVAPWSYRDESDKTYLTDYDMAFTFPQIGGMAGVRCFLGVAKTHRKSLSRVIASSMARGMFVSDQLLHRAAALEAFDRERTGIKKGVEFKKRILNSVGLAAQPFDGLVTNTGSWATRVTRERNDAAHTLGLSSAATDQYFIGRSLYWLYVLCLLREAKMPPAVFEHIGRNPEFMLVKERLASMGY